MARLVFAALAAFCIATAMAADSASATESTEIFALSQRFQALKAKVEKLAAGNSKTGTAIGALSAALAPAAGTITQVDDIAKAVETVRAASSRLQSLLDELKDADKTIGDANKDIQQNAAKISAVKGKLGGCCDNKDELFQSKINIAKAKMVKAANEQVEKAVNSFKDRAAEGVADVQRDAASKTKFEKVKSELTKAMDAASAAAKEAANKAPSSSVYVNWGSYRCNGQNVKTLYSGWTYGSYHDHRSSTGLQCLKNAGGLLGGRDVGGHDGMDLLYRMSTDHCHYANNIPCGHTPPCSLCQVEEHCYMESGVPECSAEGYRPKYTGYMFGGHYSHQSTIDRICLDQSGNGWSQGRHDSSYIYPSKTQGGMSQRRSNMVQRCHMCCKKI